MERMNGEARDRQKVMRGLKRMDPPILKGYQLHHNYIRLHERLKGATPADKAEIKVEGITCGSQSYRTPPRKTKSHL